jgi:hypothetical protein
VPPFTGLRFSSREKSGGRLPPTRTPCYARSTFYAVEKDRSEMANLCYEGTRQQVQKCPMANNSRASADDTKALKNTVLRSYGSTSRSLKSKKQDALRS